VLIPENEEALAQDRATGMYHYGYRNGSLLSQRKQQFGYRSEGGHKSSHLTIHLIKFQLWRC